MSFIDDIIIGTQREKGHDEVVEEVVKRSWEEKKDKMILSIRDLVFKTRPAKKSVDWYIGSYIIDEVVSISMVKSQLPTSMRICLVINVSWIA